MLFSIKIESIFEIIWRKINKKLKSMKLRMLFSIKIKQIFDIIWNKINKKFQLGII